MLQLNKISCFSPAAALKGTAFFFLIVLCFQAFSSYSQGTLKAPFPLGRQQKLTSLVRSHGGDRCLPPLLPEIPKDAKLLRDACKHVSFYPQTPVRIGRVTAHFGSIQEHYQKALHTHVLHCMIHNTRLDVMCSPIVDSLWNKPAFILSLLLDEMMKPADERLEWLFWVDRDTLILDQCRPVSSFLPFARLPNKTNMEDDDDSLDSTDDEGEPNKRNEDEIDKDTHLLVTNDWNGLNNGVFLVRVNQWAVNLFSDINAFRYYRPNVSLPFTEQSAMEFIMKEPKFERNVQVVPQQWFNAYPKASPAEFEEREDEKGLKEYHARRGDFLLHFAGRGGRDELINSWTDMLSRKKGLWLPEEVQRNATRDINNFWSRFG
ncbi:hypothetical protein ACLX1H_005928 [Fusarium chlamydosporum]